MRSTMQHSLAAMTTALRVLTAITDHQPPTPADLEELRRMAPGRADMPLDELACGVIQLALKGRAIARQAKWG